MKLMGFGHRVYKNYDPRARIVKEQADKILGKLGVNDELLDIAKELEEIALTDDFFVERKLYPNVDYYTGVIYRAMGFPTRMFTVLFALGRLPGLDRPLAGDARRAEQDRPPAPDLHRLHRARLRWTSTRASPISSASALSARATGGERRTGASLHHDSCSFTMVV